jgi:hypothetical protein
MQKYCKCVFCNKPKWLTTKDYIIETSKFLGYPKCCTEEYLKDVMRDKQTYGLLRHQALHKIEEQCNRRDIGFVPCKYHANRILNEGKSVRRIFRNRICSTPFPYAGENEFKKYLKSIKKKYENN